MRLVLGVLYVSCSRVGSVSQSSVESSVSRDEPRTWSTTTWLVRVPCGGAENAPPQMLRVSCVALVRSGLTRDRVVSCHTHNARPKTETRVHKAVLVYVEAMVETSISDFAGDDACSALVGAQYPVTPRGLITHYIVILTYTRSISITDKTQHRTQQRGAAGRALGAAARW